MDLFELSTRFKTERDCHDYLISLRWPDGAVCVYCDGDQVYRRCGHPGFKCRECNCSFSVTVGTIFHASKLPLMKWFQAISLIASAKKGMSSLQLARTIGVNKNTGWYMQKRIRCAMREDRSELLGLVEVDETYIGGALANMSRKDKQKRNPYSSGMIHKTPVLGIIERHTGATSLDVIGHACGASIKPILYERIAANSKVLTDGFGGYHGIGEHFEKHIRTNAEKEQRVWGRYHINTIEGFFSTIKRAIIGQYHQLSKKHLQSYMDEISFKRNHQGNVFESILVNACALW